MLALPPSNPDIPDNGIIHSHFSLAVGSFEPAGICFDKLVRLIEFHRDPANVSKVHFNEDDIDPDQKPIDLEKMNAKRRKKSITVMRSEDFYEVLNLDEDRTAVTEDQIKKSYRKLSLLYHPDKHDTGKYDEVAKEQWLKIQDAYETLADSEKRRKYDCSLMFNDAIPEKFDVEKSDFWEVFAPVFRRNAYFSRKQPVPGPGLPNDPVRKVLAFYDFWESFDSWREFTHEEEYDINQAESRSERRWMEQENRRLKSALIKTEKARIVKLVNYAYECDPRIVAYQKKVEEEKEKKKTDKKNQKDKQRAEEEFKRSEILRVAQEKKDMEEEVKRVEVEEKKKKQQAKKEMEKSLRDTVKERIKEDKCDDYFLDEVVFRLKEAEMAQLIEVVGSDGLTTCKEIDNWVKDAVRRRSSGENNPVQAKLDAKPEAPKLEWTQAEINLLTKGVIKFPAGMIERWKRIAQYIGGRFTEQECADKGKLMKTQHIKDLKKKEETEALDTPVSAENLSKKKPEVAKVEAKKNDETEVKDTSKEGDVASWTQDQQKSLEAALKKYPGSLPVKERWEKIAAECEGKSMKECVERFKWIKDKLKK